jgi:NADPH:quinone reductase-like Zn-dependent oxidoreductase
LAKTCISPVSQWGSRAHFEQMSDMIARRALRPVSDQIYSLAQAPSALRAMGKGSHFGKICIDFGLD